LQIFPTPLSFNALVRGDPLRIYGKALGSWNYSLPGSRRWRFGDLSLHLFWLIHLCDGRTNRRTDRQNCDG